jgi:hypothetical protein
VLALILVAMSVGLGRLVVTGLAISLDNFAVGFALGEFHLNLAVAAAVIGGRMVFYRLSDGFPHPLLEHCLRELPSIASPEAGDAGA